MLPLCEEINQLEIEAKHAEQEREWIQEEVIKLVSELVF